MIFIYTIIGFEDAPHMRSPWRLRACLILMVFGGRTACVLQFEGEWCVLCHVLCMLCNTTFLRLETSNHHCCCNGSFLYFCGQPRDGYNH